tara:strand:+ start:775 stop:960 length:186 start_codon:yes stop_codon:yes gene_type:complete
MAFAMLIFIETTVVPPDPGGHFYSLSFSQKLSFSWSRQADRIGQGKCMVTMIFLLVDRAGI